MKEFLGKWKIVEMEMWDLDFIDLVEPGFIRFDDDDFGQFVFGAVRGFLDCRYQKQSNPAKVEFSWGGSNDSDLGSGRGWGVIENEDNIYGMLYIHDGDESWVKAIKK